MPRAHRPVLGVYEKYPGSRVWYVRYRIKGKLVRKKIGTKQQAQEHLDKVRFLRASGEGIVAKSAKQLTRSKQELVDLGESDLTIGALRMNTCSTSRTRTTRTGRRTRSTLRSGWESSRRSSATALLRSSSHMR